MRLSYFSEDFLTAVREEAERNHRHYYSQDEPWIHALQKAPAGIRESQIELPALPDLVCGGEVGPETDVVNAIALHRQLQALTPVQAADERLWACLAHTTYWRYMRLRWGTEDDTWDKIERRWFFKGSAMERLARHGLARLWWGAYATFRPDDADSYKLTRTLFKNSEIQFGYMERLFGKSRCILHTALDFTQRNEERITHRISLSDWARQTGKLINRVGGALQLDALNPAELEVVLESFLEDVGRHGSEA